MRKTISYIPALLIATLILCYGSSLAQIIIPPLDKPDLPDNWKDLKNSTRMSGSLNASMSFYSVSQINNRRPPFRFNIYGNPTFHVNDIVIPFRLAVGTYQNKYRQEFNRFGLSPSYKWVKVHLGHSVVNFSPLALRNHSFLGLGVELNPGKIRFGLIYGRFQRKIDYDSTVLIAQHAMPAYKRSGFGLKLGYGTKENYVDLVVFKGKDKDQSLDLTPESIRPSAEENAVVAISSKVNFLKNFYFYFDLGLSAYTLNTEAPESSLSGFLFAKIPGIFLSDNSTTQYLSAVKTRLSYKLRELGVNLGEKSSSLTDIVLSLNYDRIAPGYRSMGTYFFRNDVERIHFRASFRMLHRKLGISFPIGFEHNDLLNTKFTKNKRVIGGLNANYRQSDRLYFTFIFSNFRNMLTRDITPTTDTLLINQVNRNTGLSGIYTIGEGDDKRRITGRIGYQSGKNISETTKTKTLSKFYIDGGYRFAYPAYHLIITTGMGFTVFKLTAFNTTRLIPSANVSRKFFNDKMNAGYNLGMVFTWANSGFANFGFRNNLQLSYDILKGQSLSFRFYYLQNLGKGVSLAEIQMDLRYAVKF